MGGLSWLVARCGRLRRVLSCATRTCHPHRAFARDHLPLLTLFAAFKSSGSLVSCRRLIRSRWCRRWSAKSRVEVDTSDWRSRQRYGGSWPVAKRDASPQLPTRRATHVSHPSTTGVGGSTRLCMPRTAYPQWGLMACGGVCRGPCDGPRPAGAAGRQEAAVTKAAHGQATPVRDSRLASARALSCRPAWARRSRNGGLHISRLSEG